MQREYAESPAETELRGERPRDTAPPDSHGLRILMLEDVETDAELIETELRDAKVPFTAQRVETPPEFLRLLHEFQPDLILADYSLPQFTALEALELLKAHGNGTPFILVTGTQTEEIAVRCLQEGADDYILKESLARLPAAVQKALKNRDTELQKERALAALRRSEERYRLITENTRDLVCLLDPGGALLYVSPSCRELLGYAPEELLQGETAWEAHPDGARPGIEAMKSVLASVDRATELCFRHRNGDWRTFESMGSWIHNQQGEPRSAVVVLRDVTDRVRAEQQLRQANQELQTAQLQLIQAAKMESVGRLAAGVAHEVKNPLTVILMGVEYLGRRYEPAEAEVVTLLHDMKQSAKKANTVIHGLLDFSAPGVLNLEATDLNEVVESSLALVKHEFIRAHLRVNKQLAGGLPSVELDCNKVEQVFVNLFLNAVHAMPEGGALAVRTALEPGAGHAPGAQSGARGTVIVEIEDTGSGIPPQHMAKIFDPFFTTMRTGKGTGLGLTVVKKIVELHGGTVTLQNRPEGGVVATVAFPVGGAS